ncbi:MAG: glycoside hydrolase family 24 protein [Candidatus Limnocylindrales bacterium]
MDRTSSLLLALGGLALLAYASQTSAADVWSQGSDPVPAMLPPPDQSTIDSAVSDVTSQPDPQSAVAAFLGVIRQFESNNDYTILYGGGHFSDFSHHPDVKVPINLPGYYGKFSTAAGAYQINFPTYNEFAPGLGITDFSPASQDAIALAILQKTGAYDAILSGDIPGAFSLASTRWASLPGSVAGQNPQTLVAATSTYNDLLNTITGA